jgi:ubiquinone/menaquinone biosynthesis C-methylase UbiE
MQTSLTGASTNVNDAVVRGFGDEWSRFDQSKLDGDEFARLFESYFAIFPWRALPSNAVGIDFGCGSGRWAREVVRRVGTLHCVDASREALSVAERNLAEHSNVCFHHAAVDAVPLPDASADFGYCLGVLHHVPDTLAALTAATAKLKRGAPFLLYLYYAFDNQPPWYRLIWRATEALRYSLSRSPFAIRYWVSQLVASLVYLPVARAARLFERLGANVHSFPLSAYRRCSFYTMRTDALDRFGTRLEQRYTRAEIAAMMEQAGLTSVVFSETPPFWCAVGVRR